MKNYIILIFSIILFSSCEDIVFDEDTGKIDQILTAFNFYKSERYDKAEELFNEALESGTIARRDTALLGLGLTQIRRYKLTDAINNLDSALILNPTMVEGLYGKMIINY